LLIFFQDGFSYGLTILIILYLKVIAFHRT